MTLKKAFPEIPSEPLLVPLAEAARLLGVKIYSVRRLCRKGILPYRKIGNRWLVNYSALKEFANDCRKDAD